MQMLVDSFRKIVRHQHWIQRQGIILYPAYRASLSHHGTEKVVSNHWTGLWIGLLDWIDGLD